MNITTKLVFSVIGSLAVLSMTACNDSDGGDSSSAGGAAPTPSSSDLVNVRLSLNPDLEFLETDDIFYQNDVVSPGFPVASGIFDYVVESEDPLVFVISNLDGDDGIEDSLKVTMRDFRASVSGFYSSFTYEAIFTPNDKEGAGSPITGTGEFVDKQALPNPEVADENRIKIEGAITPEQWYTLIQANEAKIIELSNYEGAYEEVITSANLSDDGSKLTMEWRSEISYEEEYSNGTFSFTETTTTTATYEKIAGNQGVIDFTYDFEERISSAEGVDNYTGSGEGRATLTFTGPYSGSTDVESQFTQDGELPVSENGSGLFSIK